MPLARKWFHFQGAQKILLALWHLQIELDKTEYMATPIYLIVLWILRVHGSGRWQGEKKKVSVLKVRSKKESTLVAPMAYGTTSGLQQYHYHAVSSGFLASPNPIAAVSAARAAGKGLL